MVRSSQSTAAAAFQAWRHRLSHKIADRATIQRVVNRLQGVRSFQAFSAWQAAVQVRQVQRAQLQKAAVRLQWLRCSCVMHHWQQHVAQKRAVQAWLDRTARYHGNKLLPSCSPCIAPRYTTHGEMQPASRHANIPHTFLCQAAIDSMHLIRSVTMSSMNC